MALQTTLENLRAKPEHVRKRIAFWTSFGVTVVIFAFWAASFSVTLSGIGAPAPDAVAAAVAKVESPSTSLLAGVGGFFGDIKDLIFGAKKIQYGEVEVTAGKK